MIDVDVKSRLSTRRSFSRTPFQITRTRYVNLVSYNIQTSFVLVDFGYFFIQWHSDNLSSPCVVAKVASFSLSVISHHIHRFIRFSSDTAGEFFQLRGVLKILNWIDSLEDKLLTAIWGIGLMEVKSFCEHKFPRILRPVSNSLTFIFPRNKTWIVRFQLLLIMDLLFAITCLKSDVENRVISYPFNYFIGLEFNAVVKRRRSVWHLVARRDFFHLVVAGKITQGTAIDKKDKSGV